MRACVRACVCVCVCKGGERGGLCVSPYTRKNYCKTPIIHGMKFSRNRPIRQLTSHFSRACNFRVFFEDANDSKISSMQIIIVLQY